MLMASSADNTGTPVVEQRYQFDQLTEEVELMPGRCPTGARLCY